MTMIKSTRRDFIKGTVITSMFTGYLISSSGMVLAEMTSDLELGVNKKRVDGVLNQANMFDLPEAYFSAWT